LASFARFLVDNGLASESAVLEALVCHVESQPPLCTIVRREGLLSASDQLRVLEHQEVQGCGYREALAQLGFWSDPLVSRLGELASAAAQPFSELLLRTGALGPAQLNLAFDEFACHAPTPPSPQQSKSEAASKAQGGAAATRFDQGMWQAFLELFDAPRRQRVDELVAQWKTDPSADLLRAIAAEWTPLRAGARFLGNSTLEALLSDGARALLALAARDLPLPPADGAAVATLILEIGELTWALASAASSSGPDSTKGPVDDRRIELALTKARALQSPVQATGGIKP
jgi:hypothetical protein